MKRIELIGASGVGKTTLYIKLNKIQSRRRNFKTLKEGYKFGALNSDISIKQLQLFCFQKVLKYGMLKKRELGIGKVILKGLENDGRDIKFKYNKFNVSFDVLLDYLKEEPGPFFVEKKLTRFLRKIDEYLLLENSLPKGEIILFDEGMLHCHSGITDYALQTYSTYQLKSDPMLSPDGIVHCVQSEDVIFNQALKRKREGVRTLGQGHLNKIELRERINKKILQNKIKAERFINLGIPVLQINTGEDFEGILNSINNFASLINR